MCSWHLSAVSVRRGSMHTRRAPSRLACWAMRQKCRLLPIELLPQIRISWLGKELHLHAQLAAQVCARPSPAALAQMVRSGCAQAVEEAPAMLSPCTRPMVPA
jgi:hypothetical protein